MPEYVEPAIRDLCERETEESIEVLLGVSGDREEFVQELKEIDSRIADPEKPGRKTLRLSVPIVTISDICALERTKSIELDERDVTTYGSDADTGNP